MHISYNFAHEIYRLNNIFVPLNLFYLYIKINKQTFNINVSINLLFSFPMK